VRAGLAEAPSRYRWSSAAAHARGRDDGVVTVGPLLELAPNRRSFLARVIREEDIKLLRSHRQTGRPLGDEAFLATLEKDLGRILSKQKPGPKGWSKYYVCRPRYSSRNPAQRDGRRIRYAVRGTLPRIFSSELGRSSGRTQGDIVRTAPARRAGSASIASRSAMADSASAKAVAAILGDTNGPEVPNW
jgi:hypothetical protein